MKRQVKTSLGIDLSCSQINLALLRKDRDSLKLLKTASSPIPEGAIKNGNIEDPIALARAIKQLIAGNKMRAQYAVLLPVISPMLMQILDIPDDVSDNVGLFVRNEIKHYAMLSMKDVQADYCGIKSSDKAGKRRAFVVATDSQKITEFVEALSRVDLNINAVEPLLVAYTRACYAKKIAKKFDQNSLFAIVRDGVLTLCLFKNQSLNFVETKPLEADKNEPEECFEWIIEKINAVLKFYEFKVHDKCDKWEVNLAISINNQDVKKKIESLAAALKEGVLSYSLRQNDKPVELKVTSLEDAYFDTPVANTEGGDKPSAVAVGLAMKPLDFPNCNLNINLFPAGLTNTKPARKHTLIIANAAAAVFLLIVLSVGFLSMWAKNVNESIKKKQQTVFGGDILKLLGEQRLLDRQILDISGNVKSMSTILNTSPFVRWDQLLNEIRFATPEPVRITTLFSNDNSKTVLKGEALSYESIRLFVQTLNESEYMKSASLVGTEKDTEPSGLVTYSINCSLAE